jgi:hypothetical protein
LPDVPGGDADADELFRTVEKCAEFRPVQPEGVVLHAIDPLRQALDHIRCGFELMQLRHSWVFGRDRPHLSAGPRPRAQQSSGPELQRHTPLPRGVPHLPIVRYLFRVTILTLDDLLSSNGGRAVDLEKPLGSGCVGGPAAQDDGHRLPRLWVLGRYGEINDLIGAVQSGMAFGVVIPYAVYHRHEKIGPLQGALLDRVESPETREPLLNDLGLGTEAQHNAVAIALHAV